MTEIVFIVEEAPEGGYTARAALRVGTLAGIVADVAGHLGRSKAEVIRGIFGE